MRSLALVAAVPLALALSSVSFCQTVIHGNEADRANRLNILLVGDGWTSARSSAAAQVKEYDKRCRELTKELFEPKTGPLREFRNLFVVTQVDVVVAPDPASQQGASEELEPEDPSARAPVRPHYYTRLELPNGTVATPDVMNDSGGRVWFDDEDLPKADERLVDTNPEVPRQVVVVILDSPGSAGGGRFGDGGAPGVCTITSSTHVRLLAHMLGHALFNLADEYPEGKLAEGKQPNPAPVTEPEEANVTLEKDPAKVKWKGLGDAKLVEGARYCSKGVWRPTKNKCVMLTAETNQFCAVCKERILQRVYEVASIVDKVKPDQKELTCGADEGQELEVQTVGAVGAEIAGEWFLDGKPVVGEKSAGPTGPVFKLSLKKLVPGQHILRFLARDPTSFGTSKRLRPVNQRDWFLRVRASGLPLLKAGDNKPMKLAP